MDSRGTDSRFTREQAAALGRLPINTHFEVDLNDARRAEAVLDDGHVAIVDLDGAVEYDGAPTS